MISHDDTEPRDGSGGRDAPGRLSGAAHRSDAVDPTEVGAVVSDAPDGREASADRPVVLVVDDEYEIVDIFSTWLAVDYDVRTALDGDEAVDALDEAVDVVLLDRRMPGRSGDDVLEEVQGRDIGCRVAMVTAVEPDFDIVEMGFDDYLTKPVSPEELLTTVDRLLTRSTYGERIREHFALVSKKAVLDAEMSAEERGESDEYARLEREIDTTRERVDATLERLDAEEVQSLYRELGRSA